MITFKNLLSYQVKEIVIITTQGKLNHFQRKIYFPFVHPVNIFNIQCWLNFAGLSGKKTPQNCQLEVKWIPPRTYFGDR